MRPIPRPSARFPQRGLRPAPRVGVMHRTRACQRRSTALLLALYLSAGCAAPPREAPQEKAAPLGTTVAVTPHFHLQSDPLINLHHFLYQWARWDIASATAGRRRPMPALPERDGLGELPAAERERWQAAVDRYRDEVLGHDLLFDGAMLELRTRLLEEGLAAQSEDPLEAAVLAALRDALPIYRVRFWPAHDAQNRAWVAAVLPGLERHEDGMARRIAEVFDGSWPADRMRVDVTVVANWAGAYTSQGPPHVTLSSRHDAHQGGGALEVLLHEACHTAGLAGAMGGWLDGAFERQGARPARDLWHVLIFVTAGDIVQRALAAQGQSGYVTLGERLGVYRRGPGWPRLHAALTEHWMPFLDGRIERDPALARLVTALEDDG